MSEMLKVLQSITEIASFSLFPSFNACGEELSFPPIIWFRYQNAPHKTVDFLRQVIATYQGRFQWELSITGPRWTIMPTLIGEYKKLHNFTSDLDSAIRMSKINPEFGKRANCELKHLALHIRNHLVQLREF